MGNMLFVPRRPSRIESVLTRSSGGGPGASEAHFSQSQGKRRLPSGEFKVYFANVTSWGMKAQDYLANCASALANCDLAAVAEHHQAGAKLIQSVKRLDKVGWKVNAVPSTRTSSVREGPGHGGVWTMVKKHLHFQQCKPLDKMAVKAPGSLTEMQWTASTVRMARTDILFVVLYLSPHLKLEGTNYDTIIEVGSYVAAKGLPYVIMGDWNMT